MNKQHECRHDSQDKHKHGTINTKHQYDQSTGNANRQINTTISMRQNHYEHQHKKQYENLSTKQWNIIKNNPEKGMQRGKRGPRVICSEWGGEPREC